MDRLLLTEAQVAAFAEVSPSQVRRAHRDGRLPRWRLRGSTAPHYDIADVVRVFEIPPEAVQRLVPVEDLAEARNAEAVGGGGRAGR